MPTLDWIGKEKVVNHHMDVPFRILDRKYSYDAVRGEQFDDNGSQNMIIHGDNLEALKALLPKFEGKIDCIYIDPPYNTGNQKWVYNDNVNDPQIQKWLGVVVGDDADDLTKHDKWLCMMYPRLRLLSKLLRKTGVILVSINDYEYCNLKTIMDEIFGERNYLDTFVWYIDGHSDNQDSITAKHEYVVCYAMDKEYTHINNVVDPNVPSDSKILNSFAENSITKNGVKNPPSVITLPVGFPCEAKELKKDRQENIEQLQEEACAVGYITREMTKRLTIEYPARLDPMIVSNYSLESSCRVFSGWMNNAKLQHFIDGGFKPIQDKDGSFLKFYLSKNGVLYYRRDGRKNHYVQTVLEKMGTTETNKYLLEQMGIAFDYPKPITLIKYLLSIFTPKNGFVLDSFAGSGTTAHAALTLNNCNFIEVEMMDYAETSTAKRAKCVISGYSYGNGKIEGIGGSFSFYELGPTLMNGDNLNEEIGLDKIREYIYYTETKTNITESKTDEPSYMGTHSQTAYYFNYARDTATTLNYDFLETIKTKADAYVIYADKCTLSNAELERYRIIFKKIPRDITRF